MVLGRGSAQCCIVTCKKTRRESAFERTPIRERNETVNSRTMDLPTCKKAEYGCSVSVVDKTKKSWQRPVHCQFVWLSGALGSVSLHRILVGVSWVALTTKATKRPARDERPLSITVSAGVYHTREMARQQGKRRDIAGLKGGGRVDLWKELTELALS